MKHPEVGGNWRMILSTENEMDMLTVELETKQQMSQMDILNLEKTLKNNIKSVLVFTPQVDVLPPNTIPDTGLKAKRVIDNRVKG
jgi:phenylacetate-coenzyme A ligase PaaK-like adenylate-forming protein